MLLTATVPKVVPKIEVSPEAKVWNRAVWPALAALLSELVKAMEFCTMADPEVTWVIVTLAMALILAKIFASRTLTNCSNTATIDTSPDTQSMLCLTISVKQLVLASKILTADNICPANSS